MSESSCKIEWDYRVPGQPSLKGRHIAWEKCRAIVTACLKKNYSLITKSSKPVIRFLEIGARFNTVTDAKVFIDPYIQPVRIYSYWRRMTALPWRMWVSNKTPVSEIHYRQPDTECSLCNYKVDGEGHIGPERLSVIVKSRAWNCIFVGRVFFYTQIQHRKYLKLCMDTSKKWSVLLSYYSNNVINQYNN